jgi:hypothetical protein
MAPAPAGGERGAAAGENERRINQGEEHLRGMLAMAIVLGLTSGAALAQTMAERMACQGDFGKYCKGVQPGGGRIIACLSKHEDKLTAACRKVVDAHK